MYRFHQVHTLVRRTLQDLWANDVLALAAQTAYWCFYSLFPILLLSASILSLVGDRESTFQLLLNTIAPAAPGDAMSVIEHVLHDVVFVGNAPGLISFGAVLTIWAGSNVFVALADALNRAAAVHETRRYWKIFSLSMAFVIIAAITTVVATAALVFGQLIVNAVGDIVGLGSATRIAWLLTQTVLVIAIVVALGATVFRFLPSVRLAWSEALVGSAVATALWLLVTVGFRVYVQHFTKYNETYGAIGAVIVLLTWMYLSMLSVITGGQLAAELHKERSHPAPALHVPKRLRVARR
jgi:membrane protein